MVKAPLIGKELKSWKLGLLEKKTQHPQLRKKGWTQQFLLVKGNWKYSSQIKGLETFKV